MRGGSNNERWGTQRDDWIVRFLIPVVALAIQWAVFGAILQWKISEQDRDRERIIEELNEEHLKIWTALGHPENFHKIIKLRNGDEGRR